MGFDLAPKATKEKGIAKDMPRRAAMLFERPPKASSRADVPQLPKTKGPDTSELRIRPGERMHDFNA